MQSSLIKVTRVSYLEVALEESGRLACFEKSGKRRNIIGLGKKMIPKSAYLREKRREVSKQSHGFFRGIRQCSESMAT
jgi:hypothetical protein